MDLRNAIQRAAAKIAGDEFSEKLNNSRSKIRTLCFDCAVALDVEDHPAGEMFSLDTCSECDKTKPSTLYRMPPYGKNAMPGWRDKMAGPIWSEFRACITSDPNPRGRDFDVYVEGDLIATAHSLNDAKARAEAKIGPQQWKRLKLAEYVEDHPYWGETTEFTNPSTIYVVE